MIEQDSNVPHQCALWGVRAVELMGPWMQLAQQTHSGAPAITRTHFETLMRTALAGIHEFSEQEISDIAGFCMREMFRHQRTMDQTFKNVIPGVPSFRHEFAIEEGDTAVKIGNVHCTRFISMCMSDLAIPFHMIVKLLDRHRKLGLAENFFMPLKVREAFYSERPPRPPAQTPSEPNAQGQNDDANSASSPSIAGDDVMPKESSQPVSEMGTVKVSKLGAEMEEMRGVIEASRG